MMFLLIGDKPPNRRPRGSAHGECGIAFLAEKGLQVEAMRRFSNSSRRCDPGRGRGVMEIVNRWCRCAQPPANLAGGITTSIITAAAVSSGGVEVKEHDALEAHAPVTDRAPPHHPQ